MDTPSTLYTAATESLVSDASATSTYEKMINVAYTHATLETFAKELRETEKLIKKDFEITSMPGPWRSGKSVVLGALKLGITLIDDNGKFHGKTFLQNKIKDLKTDTKETVTEVDYVARICRLLSNVPEHLDKSIVHKEVHNFLMGV